MEVVALRDTHLGEHVPASRRRGQPDHAPHPRLLPRLAGLHSDVALARTGRADRVDTGTAAGEGHESGHSLVWPQPGARACVFERAVLRACALPLLDLREVRAEVPGCHITREARRTLPLDVGEELLLGGELRDGCVHLGVVRPVDALTARAAQRLGRSRVLGRIQPDDTDSCLTSQRPVSQAKEDLRGLLRAGSHHVIRQVVGDRPDELHTAPRRGRRLDVRDASLHGRAFLLRSQLALLALRRVLVAPDDPRDIAQRPGVLRA